MHHVGLRQLGINPCRLAGLRVGFGIVEMREEAPAPLVPPAAREWNLPPNAPACMERQLEAARYRSGERRSRAWKPPSLAPGALSRCRRCRVPPAPRSLPIPPEPGPTNPISHAARDGFYEVTMETSGAFLLTLCNFLAPLQMVPFCSGPPV